MQVDGASSSADVAAERHESESLAVNLAVKSRLPGEPDLRVEVSAFAVICCQSSTSDGLATAWPIRTRLGQG